MESAGTFEEQATKENDSRDVSSNGALNTRLKQSLSDICSANIKTAQDVLVSTTRVSKASNEFLCGELYGTE